MLVPRIGVTSKINYGDVTMLGQRRPSLATMAERTIDDYTLVIVNNDFWTRELEVICQ